MHAGHLCSSKSAAQRLTSTTSIQFAASSLLPGITRPRRASSRQKQKTGTLTLKSLTLAASSTPQSWARPRVLSLLTHPSRQSPCRSACQSLRGSELQSIHICKLRMLLFSSLLAQEFLLILLVWAKLYLRHQRGKTHLTVLNLKHCSASLRSTQAHPVQPLSQIATSRSSCKSKLSQLWLKVSVTLANPLRRVKVRHQNTPAQ